MSRVLANRKLAKVIPGAAHLADLVDASSVVVLPTYVLAAVDDESDSRVLEAAV